MSPVNVTECDVTRAELRLDRVPYAVVVPYSTCELEGWSVVQVILADVVVMPLETTALMAGIVAGVENVKFADVDGPPEPADMAA